MKKFARVLALMLVATMLCAMLVACGAKPASDPKEAKAALEENDYVAVLVDSDLLLAGAALTYGGKVSATLTGTNGDEYVNVVWFEEEDDAKAYFEKLEEQFDKAQEELDELEDEDEKKELQEEHDKATFGRSGEMVWFGTKEAVKAAK